MRLVTLCVIMAATILVPNTITATPAASSPTTTFTIRTGYIAHYGQQRRLSRLAAQDGVCRGAFHGFPLGATVSLTPIATNHPEYRGKVKPSTKTIQCLNLDVCDPTVRRQRDGRRMSDCAVIEENHRFGEVDFWTNRWFCPNKGREKPTACRAIIKLVRRN